MKASTIKIDSTTPMESGPRTMIPIPKPIQLTLGEDGFAVIAAELGGLALLSHVWRRGMTGRGTVLLVQSLAPSTVR